MKRYTLLKSSLEDGEWYVVEIGSKEYVMAGPHKECVYGVTRLNESDLSPKEVIQEIETNNKKWIDTTTFIEEASITTNDFIKRLHDLGYDVEIEPDRIMILLVEDIKLKIGYVLLDKKNIMALFWPDQPDELIDLMVLYAKTPIEARGTLLKVQHN